MNQDKQSELPECRELPKVWGGIGPKLRAITWAVQGKSSAPGNLYDWLLADNRYPQSRGRSAALAFIREQAKEIDRLAALSRPSIAPERCYTVCGTKEEQAKALTDWVRKALRFMDLWDCGDDDHCDLDAERLTREGFALFGAMIDFDQWSLADLEHRSLTVFLSTPSEGVMEQLHSAHQVICEAVVLTQSTLLVVNDREEEEKLIRAREKLRHWLDSYEEPALSRPCSKGLIERVRAEALEEAAKVAIRMQEAAWPRLEKDHDADAAAQADTAMEIAEAIRALARLSPLPLVEEKQ